ncbi:MAG TPA: AAA family ATPase [Chloroflexota bacterium]|nr:AAA family ATPase [Chloroflexota bacterium]
MAASAAPRRTHREGPGERLVEAVVLAGVALLAVASVLPLLPVAALAFLVLYALRTRPRLAWALALLCAVPALVAILVAHATRGTAPVDVAMGYVDVQLAAAVGLTRAWQSGGAEAFDWRAYGLAVGPYTAAGGSLLGALAFAFRSSHGGSLSDEMKDKSLPFRDAGDMAQAPARPMSWAVPNTVGRGVVSLLSAPPGLGKGWWTWGMLRAMQDGDEFFGLPVARPHTSPGPLARRLGATPKPLKVLWLTEEGPSFGETAKRFGIAPGLVTVLQRQDVAATEWPEIVALVRREAWRRGCAYVVIDTVRAWCPQAEQSNDQAAAAFNLARKELAAPGLGVLFVHHDRKGGGEYGEGVAGPNNLVGSTDVLIELRRVTGDPTARRMRVSRRFGDQDVTARLDGVRYVVGTTPAGDQADEEAPPAVPAHLQATLEAIRRAGPSGILRKDVQTATGAAWATLSRQCRELRELGLIAETGTGSKSDPLRCRLTDAPPATVPPTADPEYVRYLNSNAWATKRAEILDRADGACEACGDELESGAAEVHHLTYARVFRELPEDLIALCPGCHRRAHSQEGARPYRPGAPNLPGG